MTQPSRPSADGNRPRITRTTSVFPRRTRTTSGPLVRAVTGDRNYSSTPRGGGGSFERAPVATRGGGGSYTGQRGGGGAFDQLLFVPITDQENPLADVPEGYEFVRVGRGGIYVREIGGRPRNTANDDRSGPETGSYFSDARDGGTPYQSALQSLIEQKTSQTIDAPNAGSDLSVASILEGVNPGAQFLFDRAAPLSVDPETGEPTRTGSLQKRGVYGSADSLERQLPAGQTVTSGEHENVMTIQAGIMWLRNLAARDRTAYNRLVVMLRNANYGNLPDEDAALPLNGYTNEVGVAFALAANDLAQAGLGGDNRTLMEYLTDRGQGYADLLAQQEADEAEAARYRPVDREYTDPAALRAAAKEAAIEALGRKLTDEEEARLEAHFRGMEDAFYNSLDAAGEAETQFSGYMPNPSGQIAEFIDDEQFDTERAANSIGEYSQTFMRMMGL